jgi:hypothetical protein
MRALSADRKCATMTQAAIRANIHQALDVHLDTLAKIALDLTLPIDNAADAPELILAQIADARVLVNLRLL